MRPPWLGTVASRSVHVPFHTRDTTHKWYCFLRADVALLLRILYLWLFGGLFMSFSWHACMMFSISVLFITCQCFCCDSVVYRHADIFQFIISVFYIVTAWYWGLLNFSVLYSACSVLLHVLSCSIFRYSISAISYFLYIVDLPPALDLSWAD